MLLRFCDAREAAGRAQNKGFTPTPCIADSTRVDRRPDGSWGAEPRRRRVVDAFPEIELSGLPLV
jgi:hypothetical protein